MSGVRIELAAGPLIAGGLGRGRLLLAPDVRVPGLSLSLSFQYRTEGRGDVDEGESPSYAILEGAASPPAEIPFSIGLPPKPWSYEGKLVKIHWRMRVKAVVNGFAQHFDAPITLLSPFPSLQQRSYRG